MAYFKCTGGLNPTGNAVAGDVKSGKTFSNASGVDLTGTFAAQEKTITSSRSAQTVTPDSGKYLSKVTVNALAPTGTYTASSRGASLDMGATSNYRYVNTNSVPNSNSGTYTFAANDTGSKKDLGATNTYRYVDATNVYTKGKADGNAKIAFIERGWVDNGFNYTIVVKTNNGVVMEANSTYGPNTNDYIKNNGNLQNFTAKVALRWVGQYIVSGGASWTDFDVSASANGALMKNNYIIGLISKVILS